MHLWYLRCRLQVHAAPHVAVLSTGDEVADPSTLHLSPGTVRDANRPMLLAAAADAGAATMDLGIVPDSAGLAGLEAALHTALDGGADVLITSGTYPPLFLQSSSSASAPSAGQGFGPGRLAGSAALCT